MRSIRLATLQPCILLLAMVALVCPLAAQNSGRAAGQSNPAGNPLAGKHPGEDILLRLASMTQAEREQALANLPPRQRASIEQRIENFLKMPPAQQEKTLERLEMLHSLAPARETQVRRSMQDFNKLTQDRKAAINAELRQIAKMPVDMRAGYIINSEDVSGRFSPDEQRIMLDLAEIVPAPRQ